MLPAIEEIRARASNSGRSPAIAASPRQTLLPAAGPFGFGFGLNDVAVVSEAGAQEDASSYRADDGSLTAVSTLPTTCWAIVTPSGRYAYVANAGAASLAGYRVDRDGELTTLTDGFPTSTSAGSAPIDVETSHSGDSLFTLNTGNGTIGIFRIG
jgi:6-phosphogluconolactonase